MAAALRWDDRGSNRELKAAIVRVIRADHNGSRPARLRMWPPIDADGRLACLRSRIPKAMRSHADSDQPLDGDRRIQEKMNGVFVLWDGMELWTKGGHRMSVPGAVTEALPPGVPLVGELVVGYGHQAFQAAVALASNKLPEKTAASLGFTNRNRNGVWSHVRLVAFDMPGLGELPYRDRYRLLCQVVGSWSKRLGVDNNVARGTLLHVIRQYPLDQLRDMFLEVVHGWPSWSRRKYKPFGIPMLNPAKREEADLGCDVFPCDASLGWFDPELADPGAVVNGEGLMLWDQGAAWQSRGDHERPGTHHAHNPASLGLRHPRYPEIQADRAHHR